MSILKLIVLVCLFSIAGLGFASQLNQVSTTEKTGMYKIVDTNQKEFYNNTESISKPQKGEAFYGQDAQFDGNQPSYTDNGDSTVTDNITGLMWQQGYEVMTYEEAVKAIDSFELAGYNDWRIPNIKESYSLILFSGMDVDPRAVSASTPFVDTDYFEFEYGANGERIIDSQMLSSTIYKGVTMGKDKTDFGVNFADGRIKGYGLTDPGGNGDKKFMVRFVRGNEDYGLNNFQDNGDKTVSDLATELMWSKDDSGEGMNWENALKWVAEKNAENYLGYNDWRLPNVKELQSISDYTRSLQSNNSPAIDPVFNITSIVDEGGEINYPFCWSSTTHNSAAGGSAASYVCFGEALGFMKKPGSDDDAKLMDVHGAGAQRSDPKAGDASDYPEGNGPQGDVIRINNFVRMVRDID